MTTVLLVCLALAPVAPTTAAPAPTPVDVYTHLTFDARDGLPQVTVNAITQTPDDFLWLATEEGLVRYDGREFVTLSSHDGLTNKYLRCLATDAAGRLFIGTNGGGVNRLWRGELGLLALDAPIDQAVIDDIMVVEDTTWIASRAGVYGLRADGEHRRLMVDNELPLPRVYALARADDGGLWLGTEAGLAHHSTTGILRFDRLATPEPRIRVLLVDRAGTLWLGSDRGRIWSRRPDGSFAEIPAATQNKVANAFLEDPRGRIWLATEGAGLFYLDPGGDRFEPVPGFERLFVRSLFVDHEDNLWVGTHSEGLHRLYVGAFQMLDERQGLRATAVVSVLEDRNRNLWIGSFSTGLDRLAPDGTVTHVTTDDGDILVRIKALHERRDGTVLAGTQDGLFAFDGSVFQPIRDVPDPVWTISTDTRGVVWVGTENGLYEMSTGSIRRWSDDDGLESAFVRVSMVDRGGDLWIATDNRHLDKIRDGRVLTADESGVGDLDVQVTTIHEDERGVVWLGGLNDGLLRLEDGETFTYTVGDHDLFDDNVYTLLDDGMGYLWMSSNRGVARVARDALDAVARGEQQRLTPTVFGVADGLTQREFNGGSNPAGTVGSDGRLFFANMGGVAVVDPTAAERQVPIVNAVIEHAALDTRRLFPAEPSRLPPGDGELAVRVQAPTFFEADSTRFDIRLRGDRVIGDDLEDRFVSAEREIRWSALPPGRYQLDVNAINAAGVPGPTTVLDFELTPHWWQTRWFLVLCLLATLAFFFALHRLGVRKLRHLVRSRTRAQEALVDTNAQLEHTLGELRTVQAQALRQERLRALGQMASGVAHDFNNALSPVTGYSGLLLAHPDLLDQPDKTLEYLRLIHTAGSDAAQVVKRLRAFYLPHDPQDVMPAVDLGTVVRDAADLARPRWGAQARHEGARIELDLALDPNLPPVAGSATALRELLLNLIFNAVDAMPTGGQLRLATSREGELARLEVADDGIGMDAATQRQCIEPFFTTKGERGSGLGLAMVQQIVERHDGAFELDSAPNAGTRIIVRLPFAVHDEAPPPLDDTPRPTQLRILVVDDEPPVRRVVERLLVADGHDVRVAGDAVTAHRLFTQGDPVDLVILDQAMPDTQGQQLATELVALEPSVPIILLTGFGDLLYEDRPPTAITRVVSKPVDLATLRVAIEAVTRIATGSDEHGSAPPADTID
ncbi:MAG: ATP-binding protein [Acidobacteriota bacterium]